MLHFCTSNLWPSFLLRGLKPSAAKGQDEFSKSLDFSRPLICTSKNFETGLDMANH